MTPPSALHLVVPGPLDQPTGGYRYDARIASGLRHLGWYVQAHELEGRFPGPDREAEASLASTLASLPRGARVVIDGLAMGGHPAPIRAETSRLRLVALVHHALADETGLGLETKHRLARLEREALAACLGVIVTSQFTASRLGSYGVSPERVRAAPPGTDPAPVAEGPPPGDPPSLLCVGAVVPRKGHDVLVRALARVRELDWQCTCVGPLDRDRRYASTVTALARESGLGERVRFAGSCSNAELEAYYRSSSLFVLASHFEGYGMALAEALARGLPVVATTGGATPFTVPEGAGVLVPPGDEAALAEALEPLLGNGPEAAERRQRLAARARTAELPDWDAAAQGFARALLDLLPDSSPVG